MKKYFILAAAALAFAACSNKEDFVAEPQAEQQVGEVPVAFDSYVNRATTRAGQTGSSTLDALKTANVGFGVFGYYTNADNYDQTFTPNFFYNQQVTFSGSAWSYTPIKYWPNEFGTNALSDDVDKVSFFAYAPFVSVNPTSGKVKDMRFTTYATDDGDTTYGIVGMKNNTATGDPMVKYISSFYTNKQVDLVWGTVATSSASWALKNGGDNQSLTAGLPWLDVKHPNGTATAQKVKFDFKHGLASLNVQMDTKTDGTSLASPDGRTKVFIRSVTFEGFDTKGALNLNNKDAGAGVANWYNFDCAGTELNNGAEITIKDGRKDGKEGLTAATKENAVINPTFVQSQTWNLTQPGVTGTAGNLFRTSDAQVPTATAPIYVIPNGDKLKVTIEYDVLTEDGNLAGTLNDGQTKGSVVKNVITRYITKGSTASGSVAEPAAADAIILQNGNQYTIKLHLGLNSVQFDASVRAWGDPAVEGGADLPHNN